ncbi:GOLPH3/VPS74 family protein [Ferrimonas balearica]|uniref:GOLPH3/VPS74 family protein n=1 Tax=Ferrimonas balearica TaxID=44012 RepID=UPI001C9948D7|nr:GPP34 family phosphoprotein [Ferrimonas balearica]MBY5990991.1 GPP34 family phosphoprotein [Ferrimonas balearica]
MEFTLYQSLTLLALDDEKGTSQGLFAEQALAAALMAELLLDGHLVLAGGRARVAQGSGPMEPLLREAWLRWQERGPMSLQQGVSQLADLPRLSHRAAQSLVDRGVLSRVDETVLWVFNRQRYPERDPAPERALRQGILEAVTNADATPSERLRVLIALCAAADLLVRVLPDAKAHQARVTALLESSDSAQALKDAIDAVMLVTVILPVTTTTLFHN